MKIERALMLGLALTLGTGAMVAQEQTTTSSQSTTTTRTEAPPPPPVASQTTTTTTTTEAGPVVEGKHQYKKDKHAAHEQYEADKAAEKAAGSHKVRKAEDKQADANAAAAKADDPTR